MTDLWLPGAQRLRASHGGGRMVGGAPRAVWHRTAGGTFASNSTYLRQKGFEPHVLWDPYTGQLGQFLPANVGAYALEHRAGTAHTNLMGRFCVQFEVVDRGLPFLITDSPMRGWDQIRPWLVQLGIPEVWPHGAPPPLGSRADCPVDVWRSTAGHYSHSQIPGNNHTDPGRMDPAVMFPPLRPRPTPPAPEDDVTPQDKQDIAKDAADQAYDRVHPELVLVLHGGKGGQVGIDQLKAQLDAQGALLQKIAAKVGVQ